MNIYIKIGNKLIGEEEPCFIIAEAGVNHNGSVELADWGAPQLMLQRMLDVKRLGCTLDLGTGIEPKYMEKVIGKRAKIKIRKDELITWG